jgi:hypothetical protein
VSVGEEAAVAERHRDQAGERHRAQQGPEQHQLEAHGVDRLGVGPRSVRPAFFYRLVEEVPQYWHRLVVRPGVTGFAQTRITREDSGEDKLIHDLEYIADRSIRLYLRVLGATVLRILRLTFTGRNR